jgi:hypothetical protein
VAFDVSSGCCDFCVEGELFIIETKKEKRKKDLNLKIK